MPSDDDHLLDAPIRHDRFRDDYADGGVDSVGTRHGSYWLDRSTAEAYEPVNETTATGCPSGIAPRALAVLVTTCWTTHFVQAEDQVSDWYR